MDARIGPLMAEIDVTVFYRIGALLHRFTEPAAPGVTIRGYANAIQLHWALTGLLDDKIRPFPLSDSACKSAKAVIGAIKDIMEILVDESAAGEGNRFDRKVPSELGYALSTAATRFEAVLTSEISSLPTYLFDTEGAYSTTKLLTDPKAALFGLELPEDAQAEIDEWAKAFAFGMPTAAAFHVIRAVERVILHYLQARNHRTDFEAPSWAVYIDALRKAGASDEVKANLHQLRTLYRNKVMHPEELLDAQRSDLIFGVCKAAMHSILSDLHGQKLLPAGAES